MSFEISIFADADYKQELQMKPTRDLKTKMAQAYAYTGRGGVYIP